MLHLSRPCTPGIFPKQTIVGINRPTWSLDWRKSNPATPIAPFGIWDAAKKAECKESAFCGRYKIIRFDLSQSGKSIDDLQQWWFAWTCRRQSDKVLMHGAYSLSATARSDWAQQCLETDKPRTRLGKEKLPSRFTLSWWSEFLGSDFSVAAQMVYSSPLTWRPYHVEITDLQTAQPRHGCSREIYSRHEDAKRGNRKRFVIMRYNYSQSTCFGYCACLSRRVRVLVITISSDSRSNHSYDYRGK